MATTTAVDRPASRREHGRGPQAELLARTGRRLTLLTLTLLAALVIGIGVTTAIAAQAALDNSVDRALESSADATVSRLSGELPQAGEGDGEGSDITEHVPAAADTFFLVLDRTGAVVSDPSRAAVPGLPDRAAVSSAAGGGRDLRTISPGGIHVRLLTLPVRSQGDGSTIGFVQAGFILTLRDQQSSALVLSIVVVGLAGLLAAAFVTRYVTARALAPIRAAFASERRFVADASHELRTPVALIRASAEVMGREGLVTEEGRPLAEDIVAEADRLDRLVGDLLALASAQASPEPLAREPLDLATIVGDVVRRAQPLAAERGVRLEARGAGRAEALPILGDRDRLAQLTLVLLDNAFRHSPPGGRVSVTVAATREPRGAALVVADEGPGIPEAQRDLIFEPFARLAGPRAGDGGSGLGLAIARTIAAGHGGTISVDDAPGGGARFTVRLPLR